EHKPNRFEEALEKFFARLGARYGNALQSTLKYSKSILCLSLIFFAASLMLVQRVRQEFVPMQDQNIILVSGETTSGSSLEYTYQKAQEIETNIKDDPN